MEEEKQDVKLELAKKVRRGWCSAFQVVGRPRLIQAAHLSVWGANAPPPACLPYRRQRFLLKHEGLAGLDKPKLQQEILDTVINGSKCRPPRGQRGGGGTRGAACNAARRGQTAARRPAVPVGCAMGCCLIAFAKRARPLALSHRADMAPLYQYLCTDLGLPLDAAKLAEMQAANTAKLVELEAKTKDAEENLGETEVRDGLLAKAEYLASIGDKAGAVAAFDVVEKKTAGSGNKVDLVFSQIR